MPFLLRLPLLLGLSLLLVPAEEIAPAPGTAGITMTVQFTDRVRKSEEVIYLQSDHRRLEYRNEYYGDTRVDGTVGVRYGPRIADITRCDIGQSFELNVEDGQYEARPLPEPSQTKEEAAGQRLRMPQTGPPGPPELRVETTTSDTGERKNFFGHVARHVITTIKQTPLSGSRFEPFELVTDAWYIDLETRISCELWATSGIGLHATRMPRSTREKYEFIEKGVPETGFAVESKDTWHSVVTQTDGTKKEISFSRETNITQFAEGALDPALFEVPTNFRKVQTIDRNPPMTLTEAWDSTRQWLKNMTGRLIP